MTIPIPQRPSGFLIGDAAAKITIDAFIDIQCPHSRSIWPTLLEVSEYYKGKPVSLKVHLITLSNHRQAWDMSLGLFALAEGDANKFYDFATFVYERQSQFYNGSFLHKTHDDLLQLVADFANQHSGIERNNFVQKMSDSDIYIQARTPMQQQKLCGQHQHCLLIMRGMCLLITIQDWRIGKRLLNHYY